MSGTMGARFVKKARVSSYALTQFDADLFGYVAGEGWAYIDSGTGQSRDAAADTELTQYA